MAILTADLKFFAAQYPTDDAYGGGPMSSTVVLDGVSSNVFPVIGELDAAAGRLQLRKVYAAVLSANTDALVNSSVNVFTKPADAQVDVSLFTWGNKQTTRSDAATALAIAPFARGAYFGSMSLVSGSTYTVSGGASLQVGDRVALGSLSFGTGAAVTPEYIDSATVSYAIVSGIVGSDVTFSGIVNPGGVALLYWATLTANSRAPRVYGSAGLGTAVAISDTVIPLANAPQVRIVPESVPYQTAPQGIVSSGLAKLDGKVPIFREGDLAIIREGVTSEVVQISRVDWWNEELEVTAPLANAYTAAATIKSLCSLGDLQAQAGVTFSQQTWTRVFSDALIGNSIGANYNRTLGDIIVTNEGAETERWAIVFTSATDFKLIGETYGQIASGTTGVNFSPLNPVTSQPLFTIEAAGWGTGWQAGNVLRLNTVGARAPFWAARCISPGATDTTDGAEIEMRGSY